MQPFTDNGGIKYSRKGRKTIYKQKYLEKNGFFSYLCKSHKKNTALNHVNDWLDMQILIKMKHDNILFYQYFTISKVFFYQTEKKFKIN